MIMVLINIVFQLYTLSHFDSKFYDAADIRHSHYYQLSRKYEVFPYLSNFPKPFSIKYKQDSLDTLTIKLDKIEFPYEVRVYTKVGKEIDYSMYSFQKTIQMPLQLLERGYYIIAVNTANKKLYDYSLLIIN